jgi:MscS family membrane protein
VAGSLGGLALFLSSGAAQGQLPPGGTAPAAPATAPAPEPARDTLGRTTPRGTVMGFLGASRTGENDLARQYLNTRLTGERAEELAHQLFVVLDTRVRELSRLSDVPEGTRANPDSPGLEVVGTIRSAAGNVDVVLEQKPRPDGTAIWLFSRGTLEWIPGVYQEIALARNTTILPPPLTTVRVGGIRLIEWAVMLIVLGLLYPLIVLLNRALTAVVRKVRPAGFERTSFATRGIVPAPARLLLLALLGWGVLSALPFSLLSRQFWSSVASLVAIVSIAWLLLMVSSEVEHSIRRRIPPANTAAATSLVRLVRWALDALVIFVALFAILRHFGIDPTPALAGLGVGGIAVALAAQKTLENVIAGASLIFDQAVRVGDFLTMGTTTGTVEHIGLRSTRIRTLDRTLVSVPNSQLANTTLETLSARDKYWFHPIVPLRHETTPEQVRAVLDGIQRLLSQHAAVDQPSLRVRFLRLSTFSLDIEVFAYVAARDWAHFLEIQEQLLFTVTAVVEQAGAAIALPSQTMYVADRRGTTADEAPPLVAR